jgi:hypothetical protein
LTGPSATKELIAGFWPHQGEAEIEIRQVFEAEDFRSEFTPELRKREEQVRAQVAAKKRWLRPA